MRPGESFVGQPIRSLQTMLRVIAERDDRQPTIIPDGIYGPDTMTAVSTFQRNHGMPITGVTDQDTWEAIVTEYTPALIHVGEAQAVEIVLNPNQVIRRGEAHSHLYVMQAILMTLHEVYQSIPAPSMSGLLDSATSDSILSFQELNALPMTGNMDKHTWKHLALHYPLAVNLQMNRDSLQASQM